MSDPHTLVGTDTASGTGGALDAPRMLLLSLSGEIFIKSRQTRRSFVQRLRRNLEAGLEARAPGATIRRVGANRLGVSAEDLPAAADVAATTFGIQRVDLAAVVPGRDLGSLVDAVDDLVGDRVVGRTFAVRVRRTGDHAWRSQQANEAIGSRLFERSAGVDLSHPEVEIRVEVVDDEAFVILESWQGPGGLPLGTQGRVLVLLSGGFDSAVAAWMMMRRGCEVDLLHFKLDCAQSDHAIAVGYELWRRWGHGGRSSAHVVDFQDVKDAIRTSVKPQLRQVVLKQLMMQAAGRVADAIGVPAIVTGEAIGQVSSQTLPHLVEIDRAAPLPVFRPLVAMNKDEIVARARSIGTYELSARAREVCDLSEGRRVATGARRDRLAAALASVPEAVLDEVLQAWEAADLEDWAPGLPMPVFHPGGGDAAPAPAPVGAAQA